MENDQINVRLDVMGVLRARGPDVVQFLQGQLSNDVAKMSAGRSQLAGYHNPQGRVIALLRLVLLAPDDVLAVLPRELAPLVAPRLAKFVLRAKVKIADESGAWQVAGHIGAGAMMATTSTATTAASAAAVGAPSVPDGSVVVRVDALRSLALTPAPGALADPQAANARDANRRASDIDAWRRLDIAAGLPQVYASTSEQFVAQMINLDLLDAIAFDKGCYTGQEVIARSHYRGRVKRRLQHFVTRTRESAVRFPPGASGVLADGRSFKVVDSVLLADGRVEFLAVAPMIAGERDETDPAATAPDAQREHTRVDAEQIPLPYSLPE